MEIINNYGEWSSEDWRGGSLKKANGNCMSPRSAVCELKRTVSTVLKKQAEALEQLCELKEENTKLKLENDTYQEKLRRGIKRVNMFIRDPEYRTLGDMRYVKPGIPCIIEVGRSVAKGEYRYAHTYAVLDRDIPDEFEFVDGIIKYYINEKLPLGTTASEMADYDCMKQWYLSDMATRFALALGLHPSTPTVPKYVPCAKVVFEDGQVAVVEPQLGAFDRITNNFGDGVEDLDDILSAFMHYVLVSSGKYLPCDFQGDERYMMLTDPEINTWDEVPEFLGIENNGKKGVQNCMTHHIERNCKKNKYCKALLLTDHILQ